MYTFVHHEPREAQNYSSGEPVHAAYLGKYLDKAMPKHISKEILLRTPLHADSDVLTGRASSPNTGTCCREKGQRSQ